MKRRDSEQWMHHRLLPQELRERVRRYDQYKWLETRGVDEQSLVQTLPKDLRRDIKRHLCLALVRRVRLLLWLFFFVRWSSSYYLGSRNSSSSMNIHNICYKYLAQTQRVELNFFLKILFVCQYMITY